MAEFVRGRGVPEMSEMSNALNGNSNMTLTMLTFPHEPIGNATV